MEGSLIRMYLGLLLEFFYIYIYLFKEVFIKVYRLQKEYIQRTCMFYLGIGLGVNRFENLVIVFVSEGDETLYFWCYCQPLAFLAAYSIRFFQVHACQPY